MKLKKMVLYAAPIALAGALYLGGASGIDEVLAKTIKTKVTVGDPIGSVEVDREALSYLGIDVDWETVTEFEYNGYLFVFVDKDVAAGTGLCDAYEFVETEIEVPDDNSASDKVIPTADPTADTKQAEQERREAAALKEQKATEQKVEDFKTELAAQVEQIRSAAASADHASAATTDTAETNATVVMKTDYFTCFTTEMMELLAANPDVNYEIHYRYQGKRYVLIIPAGTDFSSLESSDGYYGFRYLDSIFGGYEVVE